MIIYKSVSLLEKHLREPAFSSKKTGFIPTMGALHEGHISLIRASKGKGNYSVSSIFVNPSQFNNKSDLAKYPVMIEQDILKLEEAGCDVLFLPSVKEIYPENYIAQKYELGYLETILEGKYRPGHFQGVCQVVDRLLQIVQPAELFLGEKDYQQCLVIKKLVELKGFNSDVTIQPTLREPDGLAMSSRNMRLSPEERKKAATIYQSLSHIARNLKNGNADSLINESRQQLEEKGFRVDYISVADGENLGPVSTSSRKKVVLAAAYLNDIRLIDNLVIA